MPTDDLRVSTGNTSALPISERASAFLSAVYGWMALGLAITATTAWVIAGSPALVRTIAINRPLFWGLMIAQLGIVFVLSSRVQKLSARSFFVAGSTSEAATLADAEESTESRTE